MIKKEELKKAVQNIVNLSNEDPEEIYVTKWNIENKLKEKDPSYTKKTLAKFISDLHFGKFIFVHNGSSLPFSIYEGYIFVATESNDFSYFINSLSKLDYDLNNLQKYDYMKLLDNCTRALKDELECTERFYKNKIAELEQKKVKKR